MVVMSVLVIMFQGLTSKQKKKKVIIAMSTYDFTKSDSKSTKLANGHN